LFAFLYQIISAKIKKKMVLPGLLSNLVNGATSLNNDIPLNIQQIKQWE